ncbi:MAG: DUF309 domain-containing protein [Planctomycetes bacterium]|nr:DUF309 domain-containing protein [Planctomycetota bacterium]
MHSDWEKALACWELQDFWQVHEHFEELWKSATGAEKTAYQGLLLAGVFFHHALNNNPTGARLCAERAIPLLDSCQDEFRGINIAEFSRLFKEASKSVLAGQKLSLNIPPLRPHLELD